MRRYILLLIGLLFLAACEKDRAYLDVVAFKIAEYMFHMLQIFGYYSAVQLKSK